MEPAPLKAVNFWRVKKRGLPGDTTKNVSHKIANYGTKNSSAGKFPLKSEDVQSLYKINPQAVCFFHGNRSPWLRYQQQRFQWHRYIIWDGR